MKSIQEKRTTRFAHPALFYRDDAEYVAGVGSFIRDGIDADEPVAVSVPGSNLAILTEALRDVSDHVLWLDMTEVGRNPGWIIPGVLRAFADRFPDRPVRIVGEPIWPGRSAVEYPACAQHEALINLAFAERVATILCPYDVVGLDSQVVADAAVTHPVLLDRDGESSSALFAPLDLVARYNAPLPGPPAPTTGIAVDVSSLSTGRTFTAAEALRWGMAPDRIDDVVLAANELVTNSIVHASGRGTLRIWAEPPHLVCAVQDDGELTDPLAGRLPARPGQRGGRGLLLVNRLADLVRVHSCPTGNEIRAYFEM